MLIGAGGLTVYCFGDPAKMSDESVRLALRIHDEVIVSLRGLLLYPDVNHSVTAVTCSDPISVPAVPI